MARRASSSSGGEDVRVEGADAMLQLGRRLRDAGGQPLVKEFTKALSKAAKDNITPATKREALTRLPQKGGLAKRVSKAPQRVTSRVGRTSASVRMTVGGKRSGAAGANAGKVRHPVFDRTGKTRTWVTQNVEPGWFDDVAEREGPKARDEIVEVMQDFAQRLTRPL